MISIKPHNPALEFTSEGMDGLQWNATNFSLLLLVRTAYPEYNDEGRIVASEQWMSDARFDVRGKGAMVLAYPAVFGMIRQLLADRFRLRTRVEQRQFDVYVARLTRSGGAPGRG